MNGKRARKASHLSIMETDKAVNIEWEIRMLGMDVRREKIVSFKRESPRREG